MHIVIQGFMPTRMHFHLQRKKRRTANPRHFVVSQLTAKRKKVGMASRSDGRVEKDGARKRETGQKQRE